MVSSCFSSVLWKNYSESTLKNNTDTDDPGFYNKMAKYIVLKWESGFEKASILL